MPKPATDETSFAPSGAHRKAKVIRAPRIVLAADESKALRDRLVAEISDLKSADEAADWVHNNLPGTSCDAQDLGVCIRSGASARKDVQDARFKGLTAPISSSRNRRP